MCNMATFMCLGRICILAILITLGGAVTLAALSRTLLNFGLLPCFYLVLKSCYCSQIGISWI